MIVVEESIEIARPPAEVYAYVADGYLDHLPTWNPAIVELKPLTTGPVRVGTRAFEAQLIQGKRRERTFAVMRMEPARLFEVRGEPAGIERHYFGRYQFEPSGSGTRLTQRFELTWDDAMFRVVPWLPRLFIRKDIKRAQQVMKREVEAAARR